MLCAYRCSTLEEARLKAEYLTSAGTHGLSLRMTDWRMTLNWMLVIDDQRKASSK
jgi:hypothetical protein